MHENWIDKIFSAATGAWATFCMVAVYIFRSWPNIMARNNERFRDRLAEEAGDWERIRSERNVLSEERDMLRDRLAEEVAAKHEWMRRAVKAEAFNEGVGEARQEAQRIVSAEREKDAKKRGKNSA